MRPLQAHCHRGLGTLYAATGQREQARAALSTAIDALPRHGHDLLAAARRRRRWHRWDKGWHRGHSTSSTLPGRATTLVVYMVG